MNEIAPSANNAPATRSEFIRPPVPCSAVAPSEFAAAMAPLGPFEIHPRLAVAVSGGADSLCLAILAARWARERDGNVAALTVDHCLRPESANEVAQVARWMGSVGIDHRILVWSGPKPASAIQSAAREARYRLLEDWCREHGVWHLLVAHHQGDQAETVALRFDRHSGRDGLAAMPALAERRAVRLLRPLLSFPAERLKATLAQMGQGWIEDPSNRNQRFARVRVRDWLATSDKPSALRMKLSDVASRAATLRSRDEDIATNLLARACTLYPAGYATIECRALAAAPIAVRQRALARTILCISGRAYAPRRAALDRLVESISHPDFSGNTLGGCYVAAHGDAFFICRETRNLEMPVAIEGPGRFEWDGRFRLEISDGVRRSCSLSLGALGQDGWREILADRQELRRCRIPAPARWSLPVIRDSIGIFAAPHLGYNRTGANSWEFGVQRLSWEPRNALSQRPLWLAPRENRPI